MTQLFECSIDNILLHLEDIFRDGKLVPEVVIEESLATVSDGKQYKTKFYNLDAVISVGYRINSLRTTQFRQWIAKVLRTHTVWGYILGRKRLESGQIFDEGYFEHLLDKTREIRTSKRKSCQKITGIYATAVDYLKDTVTAKELFRTVQNRPHYATHDHTAAEVIAERADHKKEHMGLTIWKNVLGGKVVRADISIAKSYLSQNGLQDLDQFASMYLNYAEGQAERHIPMAMKDWAAELEVFLKMNDEGISLDRGRVTHEIAKVFAESEFERYRAIQDQLYESDFDKLVMKVNLQ